MRKLRLVLLLALLAALAIPARAADVTGLRAEYTAAADGTVQGTISFTCEFPESTGSITLDLGDAAREISVYQQQAQIDGGTVTITSETGFTGTVTFRVSFRLADAVTRGEDAQTLTLPLVPAGFTLPVRYTEFSLTLPKEYKQEPSFLLGGAATDQVVYTLDDTQIAGKTSAEIAAGQGLQLQLTLDAGYFSAPEAGGLVSFGGWGVAALVCLLAALAYWYLKFFRGSRLPQVRSRVLPPDGMAAVDLPCLLCGAPGQSAALLAEWAALGYVELRLRKDGRVQIHALMPMGAERRGFERSFFARLFRQSDTVLAGSGAYRAASAAAARRAQLHWVRKVFDPRSGAPAVLQALCALTGLFCGLSAAAPHGLVWLLLAVPLAPAASVFVQLGMAALLRRSGWKKILPGCAAAVLLAALAVLGGSLLLMLNLPVQVLCGLAIAWGGRRTAFGAELLDQLLGFRRSLLSMPPKQLRRHLQEDGQYFYRLLPYAWALGCGASLAARFGQQRLEPCDWLQTGHQARTASEFYARFAAAMAALEPF